MAAIDRKTGAEKGVLRQRRRNAHYVVDIVCLDDSFLATVTAKATIIFTDLPRPRLSAKKKVLS